MKKILGRYFILILAVTILTFGLQAYSQVCQTSATGGICGPYNYPSVTGNNGNNVNVQQGCWGSLCTGSNQTLYSTNPGSWYTVTNMPAGNLSVQSYPNSDYYNVGTTLDSYNYMYSSFSHNMNLTSSTDAEAAYDMWLNSSTNEVMIWTQMSNRGIGGGCQSSAPYAKVTFGGTNGVPKYLWDLFSCSSTEFAWELDPVQFGSTLGGVYGLTSGSVDIYSMLEYLEKNVWVNTGQTYLPAGTTFNQIEYGMEICSTGGVDETFQLNGWTLTSGTGVGSPTISLSPTSLSFSGSEGGSNPAAQDVTVNNSGGGTLATPTTTTNYGSGSGWLAVTVQGASAPFALVTQPSISGLPAGTYTATVNVTSSGATNSPQSYPVTLTVSSGSAPISFVQANAGMASSASSDAVAFTSNTAAGDIILVGSDFSGSTFSSIADSQGNTFTEVGSQLTTPAGSGSRLYYAKNIRGGADTVTVHTAASASFIKTQVIEYSGVSTTTPIDIQAGNTGSAGSAYAGGSTTVADDWILGFLASDGTGSAAAGFNSRSAANGNVLIDDAAGTPGWYSSEGSSTSGWSMQMAALEPGSGGTGSAPVITSYLKANGAVGNAFSYQISASNSPTSFNATGLPSGLHVNTSTGLISGTPSGTGTSSVTLSAINSSGTGNATLTVTVAAGMAFVQAKAGMASSASSDAVAFTSNTTAGDIVLVGFDFPSGSTFSSISDSQGNTFIEVGSQLTTPAGSRSRLYYAKNILGGADTVTVNTTASASFIKAQVIEYSGVSITTPIDIQASNTGSAGSAYAGGTTTVANDWILGFLASDGTGSAAAGFNSRSAANGNVLIDDAAGTPGSYSTEGSSTSGWSMQMAALEP